MKHMKVKVEELQPVYRADYREPDFWIDEVELTFELDEQDTQVQARLKMRRNPAAKDATGVLVLDGQQLNTVEVRLDGRVLDSNEYSVGKEELSIPGVPDEFILETTVRINPEGNTSLSGLYVSNHMFCTQCEAQGFRRITWFLDRPDVMARYSVNIIGDEARYPILLSNGNRTERKALDDGRIQVRWEDPFPKPSYLFALVAGDLVSHAGTFKTMSGREVALEIWVRERDIDKCDHALVSLQKSMKWDEERFGLEYDLDIYMVVAVSDFNMGAMENKGLNVFNTAYVLARTDTATDMDYELVEAVIAHEYFHNWTGNRVTCRDWFQLTLKEGLTVFRDEEFTADMTSRAVKRISDVSGLRRGQFAEDSGPTAHPVRPESYVKMDNFYTNTVYRKGAEVVRMYQTLLGVDGFRKGMDLYFKRHDGQAVTCDDFLAAMADANKADLSGLARWYSQPGTPSLRAAGVYDAGAKTYTLTLTQTLPEKHSDENSPALHIPVAVGLLGPDGADLELTLADGGKAGTTAVLNLREFEQSFVFTDVSVEPVPSVLRNFSAPVKLEVVGRTRTQLAFLAAKDSDSFNRWEALQELLRSVLLDLTAQAAAGETLVADSGLIDAIGAVLENAELDDSLKALALILPGEGEIAQHMEVMDPESIHTASMFLYGEIARVHEALFTKLYNENNDVTYANDARSIARRLIKNVTLGYLGSLETTETVAIAARQFDAADNMTDSYAALAVLSRMNHSERERALAAFYDKWKDEALVIDKWFRVQACSTHPETLEHVLALSKHPDYTLRNPNRARSLLGAFMQNSAQFHRADGAGYQFFADKVLELDAINPQTASRMVSGFNLWKRFDEGRKQLMRTQLERILATEGLSKDVQEIASTALNS
ncbi:MAG: aminopeptidase N [Planctomycetota bacterium]